MSDTLSSLRAHYELAEDDWDKKISDSNLDRISLNCCSNWKLLPSQLELESIIVNDIEKSKTAITETDKRLEFFRQWKEKKGFGATYKKLVIALLNIDQRQDAECVCKLLKQEFHQQKQRSSAPEPNPQTLTGMIRLVLVWYLKGQLTDQTGQNIEGVGGEISPGEARRGVEQGEGADHI